MTPMEMGQKLLDFIDKGDTKAGIDALYSPDAVSVEASAPEGGNRTTVGAGGIRAKHDWWDENFTVHSASHAGPFPHGDDRFAVIFRMDAEEKATGRRNQMEEVAVYTIAGDKIVREEFFYAT